MAITSRSSSGKVGDLLHLLYPLTQKYTHVRYRWTRLPTHDLEPKRSDVNARLIFHVVRSCMSVELPQRSGGKQCAQLPIECIQHLFL